MARLKWKSDRHRESQDALSLIFERIEDIYWLLQPQRRLPTDAAIVNFCEQVALQSNVFHKRFDELLELLAPPNIDLIHMWRQQSTVRRESSDIGEEERTSTGDTNANLGPATQATKQAAVSIARFATDRLNKKFKELDFDVIDAAAASEDAPRTPRLIRLYSLKYVRGNLISVGAFGEVYRATWLSTPVVIKFMGYEADGDAYSREMFFHELRVWFPLRHPHIVRIFGACHVGKRFFRDDNNNNRSWQMLYQAGLGLQYLHDQSILHNGLKCDNVLIGAGGDAKITDFDLSCIPNSAEVKVDPKSQGAQQWKSPEYLRGDRLTLASDAYSFGMTILEAMFGHSPWGRATDVYVRFRVRKGGLPPQPASLSALQWNLIRMMCAADPSHRV